MPGLHMKYFVLNPAKADTFGAASRAAMLTFAEKIQGENGELASDLRAWVSRTEPAAQPLGFALPALGAGETYAGLIVSADGRKQHHIILLPGDTEANWNEAMKWATSIGGNLPDRTEGALLFFTLRDQFQREAYWTSEQFADEYAWFQYFLTGYQGYDRKLTQLRARAVRRVPIR